MARTDDDLAKRLRQIASTRSLSDMARSSGTPVATVHRYLNGGRVTAEFCSAIIREYGVNAQWLMTGDGPVYAERVTKGEGIQAGDILQVVEAMNAVSRVRLGVLDGRHHARVLKELGDAMTRYEALRQDLNRRSGKVLNQLLDALEQAIDAIQFERANDISRSAGQVHRLCDDEELEKRFLKLQARAAFMERKPEDALEYERRLVRSSLAQGRVAGDDDCRHIGRLAINLFWCGKAEEAQRICDAGLILAGEESAGGGGYHYLAWTAGTLHLDRGDLKGALELSERWWPHARRTDEQMMIAHYVILLLLAGRIDMEEAIRIAGRNESSGIYLLEYCMWTQDVADLELALPLMRERPELKFRDSQFTLDCASLLHRVLTRRGADLTKGWDFIVRTYGKDGVEPIKLAFFGALLHASHGRKDRARKYWKDISILIGVDGGLTQLFQALLYRITLLVCTGRGRADCQNADLANAFFRKALESGFEAYRGWYESQAS